MHVQMTGLCRCLMQENKDPEAVRRRAMQDPEIQQIIADPAMQLILQQMQKDPQALREYVSHSVSLCLLVIIITGPPNAKWQNFVTLLFFGGKILTTKHTSTFAYCVS